MGRGSGRSIPGFHLAEALEAAKAHLTSFGGHAAAAGLSLPLASLPAFREALEATARRLLREEHLVASLELEEAVALPEVDRAFCEELEKLEPCGAANPVPLLGVFGVQVAGDVRLTRDEKHVQLYVRQGGAVRRAVGFGMGAHYNALSDLAKTGLVDLAFRPQLGRFRGETEVELHLEAFRSSAAERVAAGSAAD